MSRLRATINGERHKPTTTLFAYDSRDRCVLVTEADGTSRSREWSLRSNLALCQEANGTVITNAYDLLDRCVSRLITPGPAVAATTTFEVYAYDGLSRLTLASNDVSRVEFSYDSLGHRVQEIQDGLVSTYTYEAVGNRLSLEYPSGRVVTYGYDALDRVSSISSSPGGLPPSPVATYEYDGMDRVSRITRGNNVTTTVEWNGAVSPPNPADDFGVRQVVSVTHEDVGVGVVVDQRLLAYDRNQNKTVRIQGVPFAPGGPVTTNVFLYDPLNRMTDFTRERGFTNDLFKSHVLDGNGNRQLTITNGLAFPYTLDPTLPVPGDFQVDQYTLTPFVFAPQQYDENGALLSRVDGD